MVTDTPINIIRVDHNATNPFFVMVRSTAQDESLSWEARGVLAYLLSKPDDWKVMVPDLQQKCGRDKVKKILAELETAKYLTVNRDNHDADGHFAPNSYKVHETPFTGNPSTVEPSTVNPHVHSIDRQNTDSNKEQNKENTSATSAGSFSDSHEVGTQPAADDKKEPLNAFEGFVSTLDIDTAAPLDRIPEDELEPMPPYEEPPLILHECKETDIAEMIAAWWEWVPLRPALRGKPSTLADHMKIPTNREYARNLFERGVRPIDFVRVLNGLRLHPPAEGHKEMPFQYVCPMVDTYVSQNRSHERGAFTEQDPRWAAKKPGTACVYLGENLWERKDLFVDLAPRYITIAQLTKQAEETETYAPQPSEFDTWTAEDWEKDGNPL